MSERKGLLATLAAHPLMTVIIVTCTVLGLVIAPLALPSEWSIMRRLSAGLVTGLGVGFLITATRLQGGWED